MGCLQWRASLSSFRGALLCNPSNSHSACFIVCGVLRLWALHRREEGQVGGLWFCAVPGQVSWALWLFASNLFGWTLNWGIAGRWIFFSRLRSYVLAHQTAGSLPVWGKMPRRGVGLQFGMLGTHQSVGVPWFCSLQSPDKCAWNEQPASFLKTVPVFFKIIIILTVDVPDLELSTSMWPG